MDRNTKSAFRQAKQSGDIIQLLRKITLFVIIMIAIGILVAIVAEKKSSDAKNSAPMPNTSFLGGAPTMLPKRINDSSAPSVDKRTFGKDEQGESIDLPPRLSRVSRLPQSESFYDRTKFEKGLNTTPKKTTRSPARVPQSTEATENVRPVNEWDDIKPKQNMVARKQADDDDQKTTGHQIANPLIIGDNSAETIVQVEESFDASSDQSHIIRHTESTTPPNLIRTYTDAEDSKTFEQQPSEFVVSFRENGVRQPNDVIVFPSDQELQSPIDSSDTEDTEPIEQRPAKNTAEVVSIKGTSYQRATGKLVLPTDKPAPELDEPFASEIIENQSPKSVRSSTETSISMSWSTATTEPDGRQCPVPPPSCDTSNCKKSAAHMLALMDHAADPCEDFYKFACGGMEQNRIEPISEDDVLINRFPNIETLDNQTEAVQQLQKFYGVCLEANDVDETDAINQILLGLTKAVDLTDAIAAILLLQPHDRVTSPSLLIDIIVDVDKDGLLIPVVTLPSYESSITKVDLQAEHCTRQTANWLKTTGGDETAGHIYAKYSQCVANLESFKKNFRTFTGVRYAKQKLTKIEKVLDAIEEKHFFGKSKRAEQKGIEMISIDELTKKSHQTVDWIRLFNKLFGNDHGIEEVRIMYPEQIGAIFDFYKQFSVAQIKETFIALFIHNAHSEIAAQKAERDRSFNCKRTAIKLMPDISFDTLLKTIPENDMLHLRTVLKTLVKNINATLLRSFEKQSWITAEEIKQLQSVTGEMMLYFRAFPQIGGAGTRAADIELTGSFVADLFHLQSKARKYMYAAYNSTSMVFLVPELDTRITVTPKQLIVPIGAMACYFRTNIDQLQTVEYLTSLGFSIAHKLGELFDRVHVHKDIAKKDTYNWLYSLLHDPYFVKDTNVYNVEIVADDITHTTDSRFADDFSLANLFEAYNGTNANREMPLPWMGYSNQKVFFLLLAQQFCAKRHHGAVEMVIDLIENTHIIEMYRVNAMLMNSKEFAEAYQCNRGTTMHPSNYNGQFPFLNAD